VIPLLSLFNSFAHKTSPQKSKVISYLVLIKSKVVFSFLEPIFYLEFFIGQSCCLSALFTYHSVCVSVFTPSTSQCLLVGFFVLVD